MENASKALLIAGAILLAILLISLGIYIFQQAQSTINNSGMTKAEVSTFNNQFAKYEGDSVKGASVKSLIQEVNANNASDESASKENTVTLKGVAVAKDEKGKEVENVYLTNTIKNTQTYKVEISKYEKGKVKEIKISTFEDKEKNP